jgi:FkbM family methyltransferase
MTIKDILNILIQQLLPLPLSTVLVKRHYLRLVEAVNEETESYFCIIRKIVASGDLVMDIGANIGIYGKYLSGLVGPMGQVISVEPLPRNIAINNYVKKKLKLDNVKIEEYAVSDIDGRAELSIPVSGSGVENYYRSSINGVEGARKVVVETRRIDSLIALRIKPIRFIKIDVEGHELNAVRGALGVIGSDHPAMLIEVNGDPDDLSSSAASLFNILYKHGYSPYVLYNKMIRPRIKNDVYVNYLFLTTEQIYYLDSEGVVIHE